LILNEIKIKSKNISIEDSLQWLQTILPEIPSIVDQSKEEVQFIYQSSFVNTHLILTLREADSSADKLFGEISIQTDNFSVLTIMKVSAFSHFGIWKKEMSY
jgi:hypothetical protein